MKYLPVTLGALTIVAAASMAVVAAQAPDQTQLAARGQLILAEKCARCHAIDRAGASPLDAAPAFRDLHKRYPVAMIAEALAEGIVTGHPDMPSIPFVQDDIDAIIGYIESLSP